MRARRGSGLAVAMAAVLSAGLGVGCAYRAPVSEQGLCLARTLKTKPFPGSRVTSFDLEGVAFEDGADLLWIGDDNANQLYVIGNEGGRFKARLRERDFRAAFPDVRFCDNGDPYVDCSYTAELEAVSYDPQSLSLYVVNTVNDLRVDPPVDKPAIFKLHKATKHDNFKFVEWKPLQTGYKYGPIVWIDGVLYVALGSGLYRYDYDANHLVGDPPRPVYESRHGALVGMTRLGGDVWMLTQQRILSRVRWDTKQEMASWDLSEFGLENARGLAFGDGEFFVVEGNFPNPVYVLRFATPPSGLTRAAFLGGWPRSCPGS